MKKSIILFKAIRFTGIPFLFRNIIQRNKVTILLFHDINIVTAKKTFSCLKRKYNLISLDEYLVAKSKRDLSTLPKKSLIITFDDGHIGNFELLELFENMKIPVTIFLCAGIINTNRHFWWKHEAIDCYKESLKAKTNDERLKTLSEEGFEQDKEFASPQALTKEQIVMMKPYVNFQSHTLFHPCLPMCRDEVAREEILLSKTILEEEYGLNVTAISYPNGDYSERDITIVKEAGYSCGITVDFGYNDASTDVFRLKRLSVNDTPDLNELIVKASGLWALIRTRNRRKQKIGCCDDDLVGGS